MNLPKPLYVSILALCLFSMSLFAQTEPFHRVRARIAPEQIKKLQKAQLLPDHASYRDGIFIAELPESEINMLELQGIQFEYLLRNLALNITSWNTVIDSANNFIAKNSSPVGMNGSSQSLQLPINFTYGSMGGFYTYAEAIAVLDDMRAKFPHLVSDKDTIGTTYEGRPIIAVRISDNPNINEEDEAEWEMTSLHHANEVIGMSVVYYYVWHLLENYENNPELKYLLNNSELYLVPVINPDGLVYNETTNPAGGGTWRKNRKPRVIGATTHYGVDLNRNYGYKWAYNSVGQSGSNFAGNQYYRGTSAWSEFETSAMRDFANQHQFVAAFNYHAWDDSFNYPWNFEIDSLPPDSLMLRKISNHFTNDNFFEEGTFNVTLGYMANGTSDDWLYGEEVSKPRAFAFTIEVGKSFWPAQSLIVPYCDSLLAANIRMLRIVNLYAKIMDRSPASFNVVNNQAQYTLQRHSIKDASFTVSVIPISGNIISVGSPQSYSAIDFLDSVQDQIAVNLNSSTPNGEMVIYVLRVDNGIWSTYDTISKIFTGNAALPFGCDDHYEINNNALMATTIGTGQFIKAALQLKTDKDWYAFETKSNATNIRVLLQNLPADYDLRLYDESNRLLAMSQAGNRTNDTIVFNTNEKGLYKLEVYGYKQNWSAQSCYSLVVQSSDTMYKAPVVTSDKDNNTANDKVWVYPSPAKEILNIRVQANRGYKARWMIADAGGMIVRNGNTIIKQGLNLFSVKLNGLPPGNYIFILYNDTNRVLNKKIVIQ